MQDTDILTKEKKYNIEDFKDMLFANDAVANDMAYVMINKSIDIEGLSIEELVTLSFYVVHMGSSEIVKGTNSFNVLYCRICDCIDELDSSGDYICSIRDELRIKLRK